jgi:signal transduction histidine kinase
MTDVRDQLDVLYDEFERLGSKGLGSADEMMRLVSGLRAQVADTERQREELASLYAVAQGLVAVTDLAELLESIIDRAIVLVGADRGFVVLSESDGSYRLGAARRFSAGEVEATDEAFSHSLVQKVLRGREAILTTNIQKDDRFELTKSILTQQIRSVLAVPLVARGELQGAIYVDTRLSERPFGESELALLRAMGSLAAMAIRGARLLNDVQQSNEQLQRALGTLRETQDQLVQAERLAAVGRLAASVAHELRNPLMVMRNALYFLDRVVSSEEENDPDTLRRYFAKLDGEIDRQNKIINDLLYFSRNRPRRLSRVDINALIGEVLLRVEMPESVEVVKDLSPELASVSADADQIQQVFVNLVGNAVQAMPSGGTLTLRTADADGEWVVFQVEDTGCGIDERQREKLFEPFFTTKENGIGLGLSVTKSIVEGHRGEIGVSSSPGEGSVFTVKLPYELIG